MKQPYVVPSTGLRDLFIGLGAGVLLLLLVFFAVMKTSSGVSGSTLNGKIIGKSFTPFPEEQVTFGKGGVHARKSDGEYLLECEAQGRKYYVPVDKETYEARKIGDNHLFTRPKS